MKSFLSNRFCAISLLFSPIRLLCSGDIERNLIIVDAILLTSLGLKRNPFSPSCTSMGLSLTLLTNIGLPEQIASEMEFENPSYKEGKTNILEAITMLALTKSHRVGVNPNIIMFNKKKAKIKGVVEKDGIISKLEFDQEEDKKQFYLNNNKVKYKILNMFSHLPILVYMLKYKKGQLCYLKILSKN